MQRRHCRVYSGAWYKDLFLKWAHLTATQLGVPTLPEICHFRRILVDANPRYRKPRREVFPHTFAATEAVCQEMGLMRHVTRAPSELSPQRDKSRLEL